jgi:hypothetical protein
LRHSADAGPAALFPQDCRVPESSPNPIQLTRPLKEIALTAVRSLILALLLAGQLAAQSLAAQNRDFDKTSTDSLPSAPVPMTNVPATNAHLQTKPERVFDKKFFAVMGALGGAESFRYTSRKLVLENEYDAGAPWVTSVPSNQQTIAKDFALYSTEFLAAYEVKKSHSWLPGDRVIRRLWWVYPAAMTAIHLKNAVGNVRTRGPGGCTSMACAEQLQTQ